MLALRNAKRKERKSQVGNWTDTKTGDLVERQKKNY